MKDQIQKAKIQAMKDKDGFRSSVLGSILAAIKQVEVDKRIQLNSEDVVAILNKMVKQRKESIDSFTAGNRPDLVEKEQQEMRIIEEFLPEKASLEEIEKIIHEALEFTKATSIKEMGKVMNFVKQKLNGRADMSEVSNLIKSKIAS